MAERIVYLNGSFVPQSDAKVSVGDGGFLSGDGVYDVARTFAHKPFKVKEHLARLFRSLHYTRIDCGLSPAEVERLTLEVYEKNRPLLGKNDDYCLWQIVSRGTRFFEECNRPKGLATVSIFCTPVRFKEFARYYVDGVKLVIPSTRRIPPQCLESKAKICNKMNHYIANFEAQQVDPKALPLMLDIDGTIAESSSSNFFFVHKETLYTPTNRNVLGGITRASIMSLAADLGIKIREGDFTPHDVYSADEAFLTSNSPTIMPAQSLNGLKIGTGVPGPVTRALIDGWSKMVNVDIVQQALSHLAPQDQQQALELWGREKKAA